MRKTTIALAAALALSACASPVTVTQTKAAAPASVSGFATLAVFGTWEMELAPAYTRLAAVRHRAARLLDQGRINVATAQAVQDYADRARRLLDLSRRGNAAEPTLLQRLQLDQAAAHIADAEHLMEAVK